MGAKEIWKDVVGYEGLYQVSNMGRVKRVAGGHGATPGLVLKPWLDKYGYLTVGLCRDRKRAHARVHRLVAEAFLGQAPSPEHEANHKNGIKTDNRVENLEWVTPLENNMHAAENGLKARGEAHGSARLTEDDVKEIRRLHAAGQRTQAELGEMFGVSQATISAIVRRETWQHIP